jgi:cation:H+ antiporter
VFIALAFVFSVAGFILLWKGADWLVEGASRLALLAKLSPIIIGITIVAFGTSLPEMSVSIAASVKGEPGITIGNVVGSNVANVLLVLGVAAIIQPLKVTRKIVTRDSMLVTGAGAILLVLALTGSLTKLHGLIMLVFFGGYMAYYVHDAMVHQKAEMPDVTGMRTWVAIILTVGGIACILFGSDILVESAVFIAGELGIPQVIIGLTMIAVGTSLPELATSAVAAKKGESDISIGNVLGSAALIVTGGIAISGAMVWDIAFMTLICLVLVPTLWTGLELKRREGAFMLIAYAVYITSLAFRQGAL